MRDIWAVAWKEWRELRGQGGLRGTQGMLLFVGTFGILLPLMSGPKWITSPAVALAWAWVPMFLVTTVIADSFAGERERHTLETLLSTRLSERAILLGKIGAAVAYATALTAVSLLLGMVVLNGGRDAGLLLYQWQVVAGLLAFGLLGALLVASLGVAISLRARTVKEAQQTLSATIVVLLVAPIALLRKWPIPSDAAAGATTESVGAALALIALVLANAAALTYATRRFKRERLVENA